VISGSRLLVSIYILFLLSLFGDARVDVKCNRLWIVLRSTWPRYIFGRLQRWLGPFIFEILRITYKISSRNFALLSQLRIFKQVHIHQRE
jgi:hypothetical protein